MLHLKTVIFHLKAVFYLPFYLSRKIITIRERSAFLKEVTCLPAVACMLSLALCASGAGAASVNLGWDSNDEPDLEGYVVYRNVAAPGPPYDYSDTLPEEDLADPLHPRVKLTGLEDGEEYYIALTAYNTDGVESNFSNDVCVEVANGIVQPCSASVAPAASSTSGSGGGGSGGSCFISAASDESSMFSKFVAAPVVRSQVIAMLFLLLVLIIAGKLESRNIGTI